MNSGEDQNKLTLLVEVKRGRARQSGANQERERGYRGKAQTSKLIRVFTSITVTSNMTHTT